MTDNRADVDENGKESVVINRKDGYGIKLIRETGIGQLIISTEKNKVVSRRAEKLGIPVIQGTDDKKRELKKYCADRGIDLRNVLFIGNDLNDLEAMKIAGMRGCPADAEPEVIEISDWVAKSVGGDGVIRELYRCISMREEP